jgi:hypothetical protein
MMVKVSGFLNSGEALMATSGACSAACPSAGTFEAGPAAGMHAGKIMLAITRIEQNINSLLNISSPFVD